MKVLLGQFSKEQQREILDGMTKIFQDFLKQGKCSLTNEAHLGVGDLYRWAKHDEHTKQEGGIIMQNHNRSITLISVVFAALLAGSAGCAQTEEKAEPSLYERLGGVYKIATVVDDFIERLLVNDTLNANPAIDEARKHVPKAGLKFQVTALVCQATGGPEQYAVAP